MLAKKHPSKLTDRMTFTLEQIASLIGGVLEGNPKGTVTTIQSIEQADEHSITFLSNAKYESFLYQTKAGAVIIDKAFELKKEVSTNLIRVENPYSSFTLLLEEYQKLQIFQRNGIEQPVHIGNEAQYGEQCYLGAYSYIGPNTKIGRNVKIFPQCYIGENCEIGDNSILYPGVKLYANTKVGRHCTIQSGAVLGSDGFGFAPQADGSYKTIPQVGNVILEDHVDIGANTVVDCATFESTIIRRGVKLDNLIQVAHNVEIGENTVIAAQAGIAGSSKVGKQCIIGGQAGIVGHLQIGDGTKVQAQSGITKNSKTDTAWYGSPALPYNNYVKSYTVFRRLPDVLKRIETLEEKLLNLGAE